MSCTGNNLIPDLCRLCQLSSNIIINIHSKHDLTEFSQICNDSATCILLVAMEPMHTNRARPHDGSQAYSRRKLTFQLLIII